MTWSRMSPHIANKSGQRFFLQHFDDKGDHIICRCRLQHQTGIIDWEFASGRAQGCRFKHAHACFGQSETSTQERNELSAEEDRVCGDFRGTRLARIWVKLCESSKESRKDASIHVFEWWEEYRATRESFRPLFSGLRSCMGRKWRKNQIPTKDWKRDSNET